jgi:hypothetical protein
MVLVEWKNHPAGPHLSNSEPRDVDFRLEAWMLKAVNQRRLILGRRIRLQREFKNGLKIDGFP